MKTKNAVITPADRKAGAALAESLGLKYEVLKQSWLLGVECGEARYKPELYKFSKLAEEARLAFADGKPRKARAKLNALQAAITDLVVAIIKNETAPVQLPKVAP